MSELRPPSRRKFSELPSGGQRDVDQVARGLRLQAAVWSGAGFIIGGALGVFGAGQLGWPLWVAALCPFGMAALVYGTVLLIVNRAGAAAQVLCAPSGSSTPHRSEHSRAEALVQRGEFVEAITVLELAIAQDPEDPAPYLRIARIYRDDLGRLDDAERWLRRARREAVMTAGLRMLATRELVELYMTRMEMPEKAAPLLARLAEEAQGTPEGEWAAGELREIKQRMRQEFDDG